MGGSFASDLLIRIRTSYPTTYCVDSAATSLESLRCVCLWILVEHMDLRIREDEEVSAEYKSLIECFN